MLRREDNGSSPDVVAERVFRALTVAPPRSSYQTGKYSRRLAMISMLPVPVLDAARRRVFGLPAPGSQAAARRAELTRPALTHSAGPRRD
jgi:hypothetical protein